jgi:hypothetical protein
MAACMPSEHIKPDVPQCVRAANQLQQHGSALLHAGASHLMNPVNQESACRLEKTIFQGTGHKMVTNG